MSKLDSKKIAVVLCGSGYKDGSEIRESVAVLWAASQLGLTVQCFAPDDVQHDVVNCLTGQVVSGEKRNMKVEAARIARGEVKSLSDLDAGRFDALVIPGGFGVAKNLCNFASRGSQGEARQDVARVVRDFHSRAKPICAICIAPALVCLSMKDKSLKVTLGESGEAGQEIEKIGHKHVVCEVNDCVVDKENKIVTSPAYMYGDAPLNKIFEGISKALQSTCDLM